MSLALKQARFASQGGLSGNVQAGGIGSFFGRLGRAALGTVPIVGPGLTTLFTAQKQRGIQQRPGKTPGRPPALEIPAFTPGEPRVLGEQRFRARQQAEVAMVTGVSIACPSGFHPNKGGYFTLKSGFVEKGSKCVKNRRRNPMNPRALDRAIRRVDAGKSLQGKLAEITTKKWTSSGKRKEHSHT